jgi:hypothetical protein
LYLLILLRISLTLFGEKDSMATWQVASDLGGKEGNVLCVTGLKAEKNWSLSIFTIFDMSVMVLPEGSTSERIWLGSFLWLFTYE